MNNASNQEIFSAKRALEALRNGVSNGDAVSILGCDQSEVVGTFEKLLNETASPTGLGSSGLGMLVEGGFGSGKSHLLEHLKHIALTQNFVCSRVAISKETPLFSLDKVFKSAIDQGLLPNRTGQLIEEVSHSLNPETEAYSCFFIWANSEESGISPLFAASLIVHERSQDPELRNDIQSFWSGNSIALKKIRDGLRQINQLHNYNFKRPRANELSVQRLHFVSNLIRGAGYSGWVILLDEIELIAAYSLLQRGRSYSELARWMGRVVDDEYPGLVTVGTISDDFRGYVFEEKGDRDYVGPRLRARGDEVIASRAETGMRILNESRLGLKEQTTETIQSTVERLRNIHSTAYQWDAPPIEVHLGTATFQRRMRSQVRRVINEWDLIRLYPDARPDTEDTDFHLTYSEDPTLEQETADEQEDFNRQKTGDETGDPNEN